MSQQKTTTEIDATFVITKTLQGKKSKVGTLKVTNSGLEYIPKGNTTNTTKKTWLQVSRLLDPNKK